MHVHVFCWACSYQTMDNISSDGGRVGRYKLSEDCFDLPSTPIRLEDLPHPSELWSDHRPLKIKTDNGRSQVRKLGSIDIFLVFLL